MKIIEEDVKKYILTNDCEIIYCEDNKILCCSEDNKYSAVRSIEGGWNCHFFDSIIEQSDSLRIIEEYAWKYFKENPEKQDKFIKILDGDLKLKIDKFKYFKLLSRNRIIEYMESICE